jgi:hypothetical protein
VIVADAPLAEPSFHFAEDERAELERCRYPVTPQRSLSVIELATAWALHVSKIGADRTASPDAPATWGPHDLVAALYIRDFLAECIGQLPAELGEKVSVAIRPYDEVFRSVTQLDRDRLVAHVAEVSVIDKPWWWHRIPDSGPMLDELRAFRSPDEGQECGKLQ